MYIPLFLGIGNLGRYPLPLTNSEVPRQRSTTPVSRLPCLSPVSSWYSLAFLPRRRCLVRLVTRRLRGPRSGHAGSFSSLNGFGVLFPISRRTEYYSVLKLCICMHPWTSPTGCLTYRRVRALPRALQGGGFIPAHCTEYSVCCMWFLYIWHNLNMHIWSIYHGLRSILITEFFWIFHISSASGGFFFYNYFLLLFYSGILLLLLKLVPPPNFTSPHPSTQGEFVTRHLMKPPSYFNTLP